MVEYTHDIFLTRAEVVRRRSMSFIKEYAQKLVTAEEAVKVVNSHDWVDYGWTTGTPVALDAALAARADELEDVKIRGGILLREPEIFKVNNVADHFTWNSWHMGGLERKAISKGFAYYSPLKYSELPAMEVNRAAILPPVQLSAVETVNFFFFKTIVFFKFLSIVF